MNPALDVHSHAEKIKPSIKIRCEKPGREPGGGGVNVSRALKRLGINSTAVYTKGGTIGEMYQELVSELGFDQIAFPVSATTRENLSVQELQSDDMYRFVLPGAEMKEREWQQLLQKLDELAEADYLIASGSLPPGVPDDFYARLSKKARERGIKFILDTSKEPLKTILQAGAYLIKPNEQELSHLIDTELNDEEEQLEAAERIVNEYDIENLVLSLGAKGAILATREGTYKLPAIKIENKKSAVGAGDSMVAGIVYGLCEDKSLYDAVQYGLACGSAALMTPGTELVYKEDADRLYQSLRKETT